MYKIGISNNAIKEIQKLDKLVYLRVSNKILTLENNPRPFGCLNLNGMEGYRIKIGDYRVLYTIDDEKKEVIIYRVSHRKDAYKNK